jgi:hypothetical protein
LIAAAFTASVVNAFEAANDVVLGQIISISISGQQYP